VDKKLIHYLKIVKAIRMVSHGYFSDRCEALIDPRREGIGGEAWRRPADPKWPRCRNHVRKARVSATCADHPRLADGGSARPAHVYRQRRSVLLATVTRALPEDRRDRRRVWRKETGLFAQRFEIGVIKRMLQKDFSAGRPRWAVVMAAPYPWHPRKRATQSRQPGSAVNGSEIRRPACGVVRGRRGAACGWRACALPSTTLGVLRRGILRTAMTRNAARAFLDNALKARGM
jgi:hypothetical protein